MNYLVVARSQNGMKRELHTMELSMMSFAKSPCRSGNPKFKQKSWRLRAGLALRVKKLRQIIKEMEALKECVKRVCKKCGVPKELDAFPVVPVHSKLATGEKKVYRVRRYTCQHCINLYAKNRIFLKSRNKELYRA